MSSYDAVFGGTLIQPASVSYSAIALTADTQLSWPTDFQTLNPVVSAVLYVTPDVNNWKLILPSAKNTSVGNVFTIHNTQNAVTFDLYNFGGLVKIVTVDSNEFKTLLLTDNSTDVGVWEEITTSSGGDDITFGNDNLGNIVFTPSTLAGGAGTTQVSLGNDLFALTSFGAATGVPTHTALNTWALSQYTKFDGNPTTVGALAVFSSVDGEIGGGNTGPTLYAGTGLKIDNIRINADTIETTTATTGLTISSQGELLLTSAVGSVISLTSLGNDPIIINDKIHIIDNRISNIGAADDLSITGDINLNLKGDTGQVILNSDLKIANDGIPHALVFQGGLATEEITIFPGNINVGQSYELTLPQDSFTAGGPGTSALTVDNNTGQMSFSTGYADVRVASVDVSKAGINTMDATPFQIVAGIPDKIIMPISWSAYFLSSGPPNFTGGGVIFLLYADDGLPINDGNYKVTYPIDGGTISSGFNRFSSSTLINPLDQFTTYGGVRPIQGKGIYVSNDTAPFAGGDPLPGTNHLKVTLTYIIVNAPD